MFSLLVAPRLLPHGDLLPSGYRSYYMDLLLRMSILKTWYRLILRLLRIPLSSARSVIETLVETPLRATRLTRTRTLSKHARGANAPLSIICQWSHCTTIVEPIRLCHPHMAGYQLSNSFSRIICFRFWLFCSTLDSRIVTHSLTGLERRPDGSFTNATDTLSCLRADA